MPSRRDTVLGKWRKWLRRCAPRHPLATALVWVVECGARRWVIHWHPDVQRRPRKPGQRRKARRTSF